jgi:hypothetical protein
VALANIDAVIELIRDKLSRRQGQAAGQYPAFAGG